MTTATAVCEHGSQCHDETAPSAASAPEASRAWLLIEHPGPWPADPADAVLAPPLRAVACAADALGVRVQLIRRPGHRRAEAGPPRSIFAGWTAGSEPWLRRGEFRSLVAGPGLDLGELSAGRPIAFGQPADEPLFLVCTHGRRDVCCARLGRPLAQPLAARHPGQVWETTHVGGHRYAANLVILPHGLYYGPVGADTAAAAIDAYARGHIVPLSYRGRAGQSQATQAAEHALLQRNGSLPVAVLA